MLSPADLRRLARARLADTEALFRSRRFDGALYLCGYVVELALKARICRTLKWPGFPDKNREFERLHSFKTHDLDILLRLSGRERYTKTILFSDWTVVSQWTPEMRYQPVGTVAEPAAGNMIAAARRLLVKL